MPTSGSNVYILPHATEARLKIGKADNVQLRAAQLGLSTFDFDLGFVFEVDTSEAAYNAERTLQRLFAKFRLKDVPESDGATEWFFLDCLDLLLLRATENASLLGIKAIVLRSGYGARIPLGHEVRGTVEKWAAARNVSNTPGAETSPKDVFADYKAWCEHNLLAVLNPASFWWDLNERFPGVSADLAIAEIEESPETFHDRLPLCIQAKVEGRLFNENYAAVVGEQVRTLLRNRGHHPSQQAGRLATKRIRTRKNSAGRLVVQWILERGVCLARDTEFWPAQASVYCDFETWCEKTKEIPPKSRGFWRALKSAIPTVKSRKVRRTTQVSLYLSQ